MSEISALPGSIVTWLNTQEPLENISFMTEFPATKKAVPLKRTIVAVGIETLKIEDSFTENGEGEPIRNEYCRLANIKMRLAIHVPFATGGERCYEIFTTVLDCLTFGSNMNIINSGCDDISADRDTDAFVLNAWINIEADFCPAASEDVSFASFINRELLCGTHITDDSIHIQSGERELWTAPFVTGSYFGTGATVRSITLSFTPKLVMVFAYEYPMQSIDFANSTYSSKFAMAINDYNMQGLEITSTGFTLHSGSSYIIDGCIPDLNEMGTMYSYVAFK